MARYSDLIRPNIKKVRPYVPGKPIDELRRELNLECEICKMASNENDLGPSPKAVEAIKKAAEHIHFYPDDSCYYLKKAISEKFGVVPEMVHVTGGGVELLYNIAHVLLGPGDEAIMAKPTFMVYPILSQVCDAKSVVVSGANFRHDLLKMADAITDRTKIIWVANPCNPTGTYNSAEEVDAFIKAVNDRCLILFDEAYAEFADADDYPNTLEYLIKGRRVCIMRTMSKTLGLAGVRIGYGFGDPELVEYLATIRTNFSVNSLAQAAALAALEDDEHLQLGLELTRESRIFFYRQLDRLGLDYLPTQTNFIFIDFKRDSTRLSEELKLRGFLVRPGWVFGTPNHMRVSFLSMRQNKRFIEALEDILEEDALELATTESQQYDGNGLPIQPPVEHPRDGKRTYPPGEPRS